MSFVSPRSISLSTFAGLVLCNIASFAQQPPPPAGIAPPRAGEGAFRKIAPGIERTISPDTQIAESSSRHNVAGLLKLDPKFGERPTVANLAKDVKLSHEIWGLEFTFKPLRFIEVDIPDGGRVERKNVWYLCYHVRNLGEKPVRFVPRFLLHTPESDKYYPDRLMPLAVPAIERREDPRRKLLDCVAVSEVEIQPSVEGQDNSVWGVACWKDIDPTADRYSIYIQGLTNAYKIETDENGDWTRFARKTLQLNFWRPGDEFYQHEQEIRLGWPKDVDYRWVYK